MQRPFRRVQDDSQEKVSTKFSSRLRKIKIPALLQTAR